MRTWKDRMVSAIQRDGEPEWEAGLYMNGILVRVPKGNKLFSAVFLEVKAQIMTCIKRNCGMRPNDMLCYIKMGAEENRFLIKNSLNHRIPPIMAPGHKLPTLHVAWTTTA